MCLPGTIHWTGCSGVLFDGADPSGCRSRTIHGSQRVLHRARIVALHRDDRRWALLYRVLYRITHGERHLLHIDVDDDVREFEAMEKAVRRDMHKMKAFVRFRRVPDSDPEQFVAWHRPDHDIVETHGALVSGTLRQHALVDPDPDRSAHWDLETADVLSRASRVQKRRRKTRSKIYGAITTPRSSIRLASR